MSDNSAIEWTGSTWNPTTGCDKISDGCTNCYALTLAKRLKAMGSAKYQNDGNPVTSGPGFEITAHSDTLTEPLSWRKPRTVFVNSMSDLGHARVPKEFLHRVWAVMAATPQHIYQILTKRPERMARILTDLCECGAGHTPGVHFRSFMSWAATKHSATYVPGLSPDRQRHLWDGTGWPLPNVWLGTSIESDEHVGRADHLRATPAAVRFISAEPLLGPLPSLDLTGIDWLIIGGESGPGSRPMDLAWAYALIDKARTADTAVFVKQVGKVAAGGKGKGGDWSLWPTDLRIREYPQVAAVAS
jgi:protein gp37